jgi:S1-C subfamily serine protease
MREAFALIRETTVRVQSEDFGTLGSGFIISSGGLVLTTFGVVGREAKHQKIHISSKIEVQLDVGMFCAAKIVSDPRTMGADPVRFDFAVLQIETSGLSYLKLGSASGLQPGDEVVYGGYPTDCTRVSAHRALLAAKFDAAAIRMRDPLEGVQALHLDGGSNPGYTGGPVIHQGQVVGMLSSRLGDPASPVRATAIDHAVQFLRSHSIRFGNLSDRTLF